MFQRFFLIFVAGDNLCLKALLIKAPILSFIGYYKNDVFRKRSITRRKPDFCLCKNKGTDQLCRNCQLISAFVFATQILQWLFFFNPKFQPFSHLLYVHMPICVRPCREPRFSRVALMLSVWLSCELALRAPC